MLSLLTGLSLEWLGVLHLLRLGLSIPQGSDEAGGNQSSVPTPNKNNLDQSRSSPPPLRVKYESGLLWFRPLFTSLSSKIGGNSNVIDKGKLVLFCPPEPKGELLVMAKRMGLSHVKLPEKTLSNWRMEEGGEFDVGLVASIGYFIPDRIIKSFKMGMLNAHPSLLPRYRGASPLQYTLMNGDDHTGVTIIDVDHKEFDAGHVWLQESCKILPYMDFRLLEEQMASLSGSLFHQVLLDFDTFGKNKHPQQGKVSLAPKIKKADAQISFARQNTLEIFGRFQAIRHQERIRAQLLKPEGLEVDLLDILSPIQYQQTTMSPSQFEELGGSSPPGATFFDRPTRTVWIKCADNRWIGVRRFRIQGKSNVFGAGDFVNATGIPNFKESSFL